TGENEAMSDNLKSIGVINDQSTTLEVGEGEKLQAKATGGIVVAQEVGEGEIILKARVKEPAFDFEAGLTGAILNAVGDEMTVKTHVINEDMSVEVTPKNIGATGIRIRKSNMSYKPGYSEGEGYYADITWTVLACEDEELYTKFKKKALPICTPAALSFTAAADATGKIIAVSGLAGAVSASADQSWAMPTVSGQNVTVKVTANSGTARTAQVLVTVNGSTNKVLISQAGA
ncbi:MAG: BACON domain-containing carbohydrate-binding protein, partial [Alistipes sp.]